jgi:hypothetical protein
MAEEQKISFTRYNLEATLHFLRREGGGDKQSGVAVLQRDIYYNEKYTTTRYYSYQINRARAAGVLPACCWRAASSAAAVTLVKDVAPPLSATVQ